MTPEEAKLVKALELLSQAQTDREIYRPDMENEERLAEYDDLSSSIDIFLKENWISSHKD
jgi:hypothetical protein